jgi:CheY-like chemotaxis protein
MSDNYRTTPGIPSLPKSGVDSNRNGSAPAAVPQTAHTTNSVPRLTLLVVEDDPDTQAFMRALLGRHYEVVTAASEEEFWSVLEDIRPSLILMDVSLRGSQDGLTLTRQFRAQPRWNPIPVVALTAHATTEDRERALDAGCASYVSKPVVRRRLMELIASLIAPEQSLSGTVVSTIVR